MPSVVTVVAFLLRLPPLFIVLFVRLLRPSLALKCGELDSVAVAPR